MSARKPSFRFSCSPCAKTMLRNLENLYAEELSVLWGVLVGYSDGMLDNHYWLPSEVVHIQRTASVSSMYMSAVPVIDGRTNECTGFLGWGENPYNVFSVLLKDKTFIEMCFKLQRAGELPQKWRAQEELGCPPKLFLPHPTETGRRLMEPFLALAAMKEAL
jgi:hypothetical protein